MKLLIYDYRGSFVPPFKRTVLRSKVVCRFCQATTDRKTDARQNKAGLDYDPAKDTQRHCEKMPVGTDAMQMITSVGPTGTAYICLKCARELVKNLTEELAK